MGLSFSLFCGGGFSWEKKLVAPLIAAPNGEMHKWEDKGTEHKCLTTGYACNCNAKEITILFCKQIGRSPNMSYATKCRVKGKGKWKWQVTALVPALFLCLKLPVGRQ